MTRHDSGRKGGRACLCGCGQPVASPRRKDGYRVSTRWVPTRFYASKACALKFAAALRSPRARRWSSDAEWNRAWRAAQVAAGRCVTCAETWAGPTRECEACRCRRHVHSEQRKALARQVAA